MGFLYVCINDWGRKTYPLISRRDKIIQPWVGKNELPWGSRIGFRQP
jgi:hypothetical protein